MANILDQLFDIVPSIIRRLGPENPPGSSFFIVLVALCLSLSLTLLSRYLIDTDKLARYTKETKAHNKMKMRAMRTADKKLQLQVDRQARRAKKMQSELMNMRMRPLMFYMLPLMIIFISMSSYYNFEPGSVFTTSDITLEGLDNVPDEDIWILSHVNNTKVFYNETLRVVGEFNTSTNGAIWFNINGSDIIQNNGTLAGKAKIFTNQWIVEAEPKTLAQNNSWFIVHIFLNSTIDNSSIAMKTLNVTIGDKNTIPRIQVTSHLDTGSYFKGKELHLFGTFRSANPREHTIRDKNGRWADRYNRSKTQTFWNLSYGLKNDDTFDDRLELYKISKSKKPLAAIFPFAIPTKLLWLEVGWTFKDAGRTYFVPRFVWWYFSVNISFGAAMQKIAGLSPD